jgi:serine/threonine protein kinase/formylglycine-generating enzyme required for sulfatase activity
MHDRPTFKSTTDPQDLCAGCFERKGSHRICSRCQFDESRDVWPTALPVRSRIGGRGRQFVTGRMLGEPGGFGITYLAWDLKNDEKVAIKELFIPDLVERGLDGREVVARVGKEGQFEAELVRFVNEASSLAELHHPNIVRFRWYFEANKTAYLVMDYLEGRTLAQHLAELDASGAHMPVAESIDITMGILRGLDQCVHPRGLVHRDIKPANIYLREDASNPVLLDFGAARKAKRTRGADGKVTAAIGTAGYAAPEQYGLGRLQPTVDIYACGAVLYEMLTGQPPVEAPLRGQVGDDRLPPPRALRRPIPAALSILVLRALSLDPEDRPQNASEFEARLLRLRTATRRRMHLAIAMVAIAAVSVGGYFWFRPDPVTPDTVSSTEETGPIEQTNLTGSGKEIDSNKPAGSTGTTGGLPSTSLMTPQQLTARPVGNNVVEIRWKPFSGQVEVERRLPVGPPSSEGVNAEVNPYRHSLECPSQPCADVRFMTVRFRARRLASSRQSAWSDEIAVSMACSCKREKDGAVMLFVPPPVGRPCNLPDGTLTRCTEMGLADEYKSRAIGQYRAEAPDVGKKEAEQEIALEIPRHRVPVDAGLERGFLLDKHEVTNQQYRGCVDDKKCSKPTTWKHGKYDDSKGDYPVTGVTWIEAKTYCDYVGASLPLEEEFEWASTDGREVAEFPNYPWGTKPPFDVGEIRANLASTANPDRGSTTPRCKFKPNVFGLCDVAGNAAEWTWNCYQPYSKTLVATLGGPPHPCPKPYENVFRGGSFSHVAVLGRATVRGHAGPDEETEWIGFRCRILPAGG